MRDLTPRESKILHRMLERLPTAQTALANQAKYAKVDTIDEEGSLRFFLKNQTKAADTVIERVPITATFNDTDGMPIYLLLHVVAGKLWELEIYKSDGSRIITPPTAEGLYF